jgi:probable addiction module antidote protein
MAKIQPFDTARHLDNPEVISYYLAEALETRDPRLILRAIRNVARARRISEIARETGLSRTSLYWKEKTSPEFTTVLKVLDAVGVHLEPVPSRNPPAVNGACLHPGRRRASRSEQEPRTRRKAYMALSEGGGRNLCYCEH